MDKTAKQKHSISVSNSKAEAERRRRRLMQSVIKSEILEDGDKIFMLDLIVEAYTDQRNK